MASLQSFYNGVNGQPQGLSGDQSQDQGQMDFVEFNADLNSSDIINNATGSASQGFKPFYIVPLPTQPAPVTPPPEPLTTTIDPFEKLMGFLYNVGYANKSVNFF